MGSARTSQPIVCIDTDVIYLQAGIRGVPGSQQPWELGVFEITYVSVSAEDFEVVSERWGFGPAANGYVDSQHLLSAAAQGTVPMSEGDPVSVDLTWDLSDADVEVAGTNGPYNGFSWGRHGRDGCLVENLLAHQRYRWTDHGVTGSLGGVDMEDLYVRNNDLPGAFIEGRSTFKYIINETGPNCVPA